MKLSEEDLKSYFDGGMSAGEKADDMDQLKSSRAPEPDSRDSQDTCGPKPSLLEFLASAFNIPASAIGAEINNLHEYHVAETKRLRQELDVRLQILKDSNRKSRERSIAITKLQEAIMWLGMDLKEQGTPNPYPQSYNPNSQVIEPTADNLKL